MIASATMMNWFFFARIDIKFARNLYMFSIFSGSLVEGSRLVVLESAQYSDNGQYICTAMAVDPDSNETVTLMASFYVNIQG